MSTASSTSNKLGLNVTQKKALGISAATVLLGGTALLLMQCTTGKGEPQDKPEPPRDDFPNDIDVAGKVTDDMSFEQAFAAARNEVGMGGVFGWHGHWYNTFEKDEWSSLSLEQRQDYTEMITGEKLPVQVYHKPNSDSQTTPAEQSTEPTAIEGSLNGQRVIGLDYNHDGVIDVLVMEGEDGNIYKVADATGDDGLDTIYQYDALDGELTAVARLSHSVVLSNDQFSQALEESMSKEVVDSILEPDDSAPATPDAVNETTNDDDDADDNVHHLTASHEPADDTYVNDGDVQDMDE
jgi:hypothetical protein